MPVRIRLSRVGKKHAPFYRIVAVDSRKKRDGAFLDDLGTYDALNSVVVRFDEQGYARRIETGALPSDSVKKIYKLYKEGATQEALLERKKVAVAQRKAAPTPKKKVQQKPKAEASAETEAQETQ